ncbi:diguanylate cyclase/phosphodiesterase (GGDEF & EAL domains) with PAS/PAC sensor [Hydrogenimonas sp.]|nr:diguanylate cyclase/phosphodiesterase (GGDEF & EAL domains) with PAS/PAC sensor [Hydrogenimonas sp.]
MKKWRKKEICIIVAFIALTDIAALVQFFIIEVGSIKFYYFIIPSAVGAVFGTILVLTRHYYGKSKLADSFEKAAKTDFLTGTLNRFAFYELIKSEIERSKRKGRVFSLAMLDLDDFKVVNDRYGHQKGDDVLVSFCELVNSELRAVDRLNRWGGEEFMALLPETTVDEALVITERIRSKVGENCFGLKRAVTVSIGITQYRDNDTIESLVERVDSAVYDAKRLGKNRIEIR